eukprot:1345886-Pyramimonas_sp.AAC.1
MHRRIHTLLRVFLVVCAAIQSSLGFISSNSWPPWSDDGVPDRNLSIITRAPIGADQVDEDPFAVETFYTDKYSSHISSLKAAISAVSGGKHLLNARYYGSDDSVFRNRHKGKLVFPHKFNGITTKLEMLVDAVKRNQGKVFLWVDASVWIIKGISPDILGDHDLLLIREILPKSYINIGVILLRATPT